MKGNVHLLQQLLSYVTSSQASTHTRPKFICRAMRGVLAFAGLSVVLGCVVVACLKSDPSFYMKWYCTEKCGALGLPSPSTPALHSPSPSLSQGLSAPGGENIQAPATRSPRQEAAIATKHLYIDLGARDGDTVEEYVKKHEKEFRAGTLQILAVEANPETIPFFRARMQKLGRDFPLVDSHVTLFHQAAWNSSTTLTFHLDTGKRPWRKGARAEQELSGGSVFRSPYATKGDAHVEAFDTADWISKHCVKDGRKYPFVFLKMDIEGAEYPVIRNLLNRPEVLGLVDEWLVEFHDGKTNPWKPLVASDTLQQDFKSAVVAKGAKYHDRH